MKNLLQATVALAALVVLAPSVARAQAVVTRPLSMTADSQQVITLATWAIHAEARGQVSHLGRFTGQGSGFVGYPESEYGQFIAANGDALDYQGTSTPMLYTITGGTGRFAGASGSFVVTGQIVDMTMDDKTMTLYLKWTAVGTIAY